MWHTGSTMGFRTVIERFTGNNLTIIILCNRTDLDPEALALKTADLYLNLKPKVCFFRFGNPAGYVAHQQTENFTAQFFISMGPFFVNTLLCVIFCSAAFLPVWELKVFDPLAYFFYWLGLSIGMHAFPSTQDLSHLWDRAPSLAKKGNLLAILSLPLAGLLVIANYARVVWADLGYGILVGVLAPIAIFKALAQ